MAAFNQQQVPFAFDPANNLWSGNTSSPGPNPFSPAGQANPPSNLNPASMGLNPASPGSLGAILNPGFLYSTSTNSSTSGPADTPQSGNTNSNAASPPGQQQNQVGGNGASREGLGFNSNGPFMGNPDSQLMGNTGNRGPTWSVWTSER